MRPGDRLICAFVNSYNIGFECIEWPLHVTIVPWFRAEITDDELVILLKKTLQNIPPFTAIVGESAQFGHQKGKSAALVVEPTTFHDIERGVRKILHEQKAWIVDESTKRRRSYRPHVTQQKSSKIALGEEFLVRGVYVIEQLGNKKKVTKKVELKHEETA